MSQIIQFLRSLYELWPLIEAFIGWLKMHGINVDNVVLIVLICLALWALFRRRASGSSLATKPSDPWVSEFIKKDKVGVHVWAAMGVTSVLMSVFLGLLFFVVVKLGA